MMETGYNTSGATSIYNYNAAPHPHYNAGYHTNNGYRNNNRAYDNGRTYNQGGAMAMPCGQGDDGLLTCTAVITGCLQSLFGIVSIVLGGLIAAEYGFGYKDYTDTDSWFSFGYTNIGIAIWAGVIYLLAGLIGSFICCFGWGSSSMYNAQRCMMMTYMIVSGVAAFLAMAHLIADAIFSTHISGNSYSCYEFTDYKCDYFRGLLIGSVIIAVLEFITAVAACVLSCCCGGCYGQGMAVGEPVRPVMAMDPPPMAPGPPMMTQGPQMMSQGPTMMYGAEPISTVARSNQYVNRGLVGHYTYH